MRYRGGGVGHRAVRKATDSFLNDRPREELGKEKGVEGNGEDENDRQTEPATLTEPINLEDIPNGHVIEEEGEEEGEE